MSLKLKVALNETQLTPSWILTSVGVTPYLYHVIPAKAGGSVESDPVSMGWSKRETSSCNHPEDESFPDGHELSLV